MLPIADDPAVTTHRPLQAAWLNRQSAATRGEGEPPRKAAAQEAGRSDAGYDDITRTSFRG